MVGAIGIGYVVGARSGPAVHPMVCESDAIMMMLEVSSYHFYVISCDERFLGHSGFPDLCHTEGMGVRERNVVDDECQPYSVQFSVLFEGS